MSFLFKENRILLERPRECLLYTYMLYYALKCIEIYSRGLKFTLPPELYSNELKCNQRSPWALNLLRTSSKVPVIPSGGPKKSKVPSCFPLDIPIYLKHERLGTREGARGPTAGPGYSRACAHGGGLPGRSGEPRRDLNTHTADSR